MSEDIETTDLSDLVLNKPKIVPKTTEAQFIEELNLVRNTNAGTDYKVQEAYLKCHIGFDLHKFVPPAPFKMSIGGGWVRVTWEPTEKFQAMLDEQKKIKEKLK